MNPAYRPMLATLVDEPFDEKEWVFETKWDGFRLITEKADHNVKLWSRNGIDVTTTYAVLLPALQKIEGSRPMGGRRRPGARGAKAVSKIFALNGGIGSRATPESSGEQCCSDRLNSPPI